MLNHNNTLDICEFFSVCSQLILRAGNIIQETFDPKNLCVKIKHGYEPYTVADVKIQTLIIEGLRSVWPTMRIIGEEEETYQGKLGFQFEDLHTDIVSPCLFSSLGSTEVDLNNVIVWVDPLDGTWEFVQGCLDSVTTLIGISINGESKIGVIGKYYINRTENDYQWSPKCYFAHADNPHIYYFDYLDNQTIVRELLSKKILSENGLSICTSKSCQAFEDFKKFFDVINPDVIAQVGGAGNKVLHVVEGKSDCYFFPRSGMKKWDICAGEAIIKSIGGIVTDSKNQGIQYKEEKSTWACSKGVIASISMEKHTRVTKVL